MSETEVIDVHDSHLLCVTLEGEWREVWPAPAATSSLAIIITRVTCNSNAVLRPL